MQAINFRPKVNPQKLREIAKKQHYADLSSFINEAIDEKIRHIHESPRDHKLVSSIKKAVHEYNGWAFSKPPASEAAEIKKRAADMRSGKAKSTPLSEVIKKLEKNLTYVHDREKEAGCGGQINENDHQKRKLEGFITTQEHMRRLRKKRPEVYSALKHPGLRTCVAWNTLDHRIQLGFSQAQLAEKSGVSRRSVRNLEDITTKFSPTLDVIEKVSKALKVESADLLKQVDLTKTV